MSRVTFIRTFAVLVAWCLAAVLALPFFLLWSWMDKDEAQRASKAAGEAMGRVGAVAAAAVRRGARPD